MIVKKALAIAVVGLLSLLLTSSAALTGNPEGTGQPGAPNVACGEGNATVQPPGFLTEAFLTIATLVYAGSPGTPSALNANSSHAISQHDIACYQQTQNH